MKILVPVAIAAGLIGIPVVAVANIAQSPTHQVVVDHPKLPPAGCADAKATLANYGLSRDHPCRLTTVMKQWESGVDTPKATSTTFAAASGCDIYKRKSCPYSVARKVRWHFNECWGMFNHCTDHDSPAWWKVQQAGRYFKGWPCRVSRWIPAPYNCKRYYTWTRDYTWHWRHYNPPNRAGFHRCNSVSGSGFTTSVDSCYRVRAADPSGTPRRFPYSRSGHGKVGMVWTACGFTQCRTYRVGVGLYPGARGARRGG